MHGDRKKGKTVHTVAIQDRKDDRAQIDALTSAFFNAFSRKDGGNVNLDTIYRLFIPEGLIVKACADATQSYSVVGFIEPREKLLNGAALTSFREEELSGRTDIFGNIAQRFSSYRKWGVLSGEAFENQGMKVFQFVRMPAGWRISALAWYDD